MYEPRSKENDDKDERCRLQDQFSSIELLDGRLDLFLLGGVVAVRKIATHLGEREVFGFWCLVFQRGKLTSSGKVLFPNSALPAVQILVNLKFLNNCFLHKFFPSPPITSSTTSLSLPTSQADWSGRFQKGRETQPAQHWPTSSTPMSVQSSCPLKNKIVK